LFITANLAIKIFFLTALFQWREMAQSFHLRITAISRGYDDVLLNSPPEQRCFAPIAELLPNLHRITRKSPENMTEPNKETFKN
jgi:hypothetical protein